MRSALCLVALCGTAAADVVDVSGRLDGIHARLTVRETILVDAAVSQHELGLPFGATIVGATAKIGAQRRSLALVGAQAGHDAFDALVTRVAGPSPRHAVLISADGNVAIAAAKGELVTLELDVQMPTCRAGGVRYVGLPHEWSTALDRDLRTRVKHKVSECQLFDPSGDAEALVVAFADPITEPVRAIAARIATASRHVAVVELEAAVTTAPRDLATAIVVDVSRSMQAHELFDQRQIVAAYLRAAPSQRVQVIAFARTAKALLPDWVPAASVAGKLDRDLEAIATSNGSNLDAGLAEAGRWLARITGTRRILVITDERLPHALAARAGTLHQRLPAGTLVHIVTLDGNELVHPDATSLLAPLAATTGGLALRGARIEDAGFLVHPHALDVVIAGPGWTMTDSSTCRGVLVTGGSCTWFATGTATSGAITITGRSWNTPIRPVAVRLGPAAVMARDLGNGDATIAAQARAVSSEWSLFVEWAGSAGHSAKPLAPTVPFARHDPLGKPVSPVIPPVAPPHVAPAYTLRDLKPLLARGVSWCAPKGTRVTADVETVADEIVAVVVAIAPVDAHVQRCIEDEIWATKLTVPRSLKPQTLRLDF